MKIKKLKELQDGCCGDTLTMEVIDLVQFSTKYAVILLAAAPGYRSCRQASGTKNADIEGMDEDGDVFVNMKEYWDKIRSKV